MSSKLCSLNGIAKSDCGASRGYEKSFPLKDCNEDVNAHPVSCHLSKKRLTEKDLIFARAGLFSLSEMQIEKMSVCPKHKHSLGRFWRPPGHVSILAIQENLQASPVDQTCHRLKLGKRNLHSFWSKRSSRIT